MQNLKRKEQRRAFKGLAGSFLSRTSAVPKHAGKPKPLPQSRNLVLVHFCFDQKGGDQKSEWCSCNQRIDRKDAFRLVRENRADWLLVKNPKTSHLVKFTRAVVIRRIKIGDEFMYALQPPIKPDRRDVKHVAIKAGIRTKARIILEKLVAKGVIPAKMAALPDPELDELFQAGPGEEFLTLLSEQGERFLRTKMIGVVRHWWNNVLGYVRLTPDAGKFLTQADRGTGLIVYAHETPTGDIDQIADRASRGDNYNQDINPEEIAANERHVYGHGQKVAVANYRASFWCGDWDYSTGANPRLYENRKFQSSEPEIETGLREIGIGGTKSGRLKIEEPEVDDSGEERLPRHED